MMGTGMALPMGGAVAVNQDQRKGSLIEIERRRPRQRPLALEG